MNPEVFSHVEGWSWPCTGVVVVIRVRANYINTTRTHSADTTPSQQQSLG